MRRKPQKNVTDNGHIERKFQRFLAAKHIAEIFATFPEEGPAREYFRVLGLAIDWQYQKGRSRAVDWDGPVVKLVAPAKERARKLSC